MTDENKKYFLVTVVVLCAILTWIFGTFLEFVADFFNWYTTRIFGVFPLYYSIAAIVMTLLFFWVMNNRGIELFSSEVVSEVKKVSWPTSSDTFKSTGVILIVVFICSLILWVYDSVFTKLLEFLIKQ